MKEKHGPSSYQIIWYLSISIILFHLSISKLINKRIQLHPHWKGNATNLKNKKLSCPSTDFFAIDLSGQINPLVCPFLLESQYKGIQIYQNFHWSYRFRSANFSHFQESLHPCKSRDLFILAKRHCAWKKCFRFTFLAT